MNFFLFQIGVAGTPSTPPVPRSPGTALVTELLSMVSFMTATGTELPAVLTAGPSVLMLEDHSSTHNSRLSYY